MCRPAHLLVDEAGPEFLGETRDLALAKIPRRFWRGHSPLASGGLAYFFSVRFASSRNCAPMPLPLVPFFLDCLRLTCYDAH